MLKSALDMNELLKKMTSESVRQGENVRNAVRDLTLQALQQRDLSLKQIRQVLASVTEGASLGAVKGKLDLDKTFGDVLEGMDQALLKAVDANRIALEQLVGAGKQFNDTHVQKALADLEKLEDEFLKSVKKASSGATGQVQAQWSELLKHTKLSGTQTGAHATETLEGLAEQMREGARKSRAATIEAAQALSQNFATFASGILIGLTEAMTAGQSPTRKKK